MRKASTVLLEQGTQTPSPAPDLIPAERLTENLHRNWYSKRGRRKSFGARRSPWLCFRFFYGGFTGRCLNPKRVAAMATATMTVRSTAKSIAAVSSTACSERISAARKSKASEIPR